MVKIHWLIASCLSVFLFGAPAEAGKLLFWRFESNQNRLVFSTDEGVQPTAQLIPNPTRLVIDLPGTILGRPGVNQPIGGAITNIRVGQFNSQITRLVIELAPGYTLDPQQIKIRGLSPTQWTVDLPTPQRITNSSVPNTPNPSNTPAPNYPNNNQSSNSNVNSSPPSTNSSLVQVTNSGLVIKLNGNSNTKVEINRSRDRRRIDIDLIGVTIPSNLLSQPLPVNEYGISNIEFSQSDDKSPVGRVTLNVDRDSPDWNASFSRFGDLVLWPVGGINSLAPTKNNPSNRNINNVSLNTSVNTPTSLATIQGLELNRDSTQLLIRSDGVIQAQGQWNNNTGVYEITIPKAKIADNFNSPQLPNNSPLARVRLWQPDSQTVVILVQPSLGVRLEQLQAVNNNLVALQIRRFGTVATVNSATTIPVPPAPNIAPLPSNPVNLPPVNSYPSNPLPSVPRGTTVVVIDPGHGGKDPGAIGIGGLQEKHVIFPIAQQVAQILESQGVKVIMTRNADYFVTLEGRSVMANQARANIFVSIHANSAGANKPQVSGLETYYYQSGKRLADIVHKNILRRVDVRDRGVRTARFYVLRKSNMPSILIETGFLTGQEDAAKLGNSSYRSQMAQAIASGILEYIQLTK